MVYCVMAKVVSTYLIQRMFVIFVDTLTFVPANIYNIITVIIKNNVCKLINTIPLKLITATSAD